MEINPRESDIIKDIQKIAYQIEELKLIIDRKEDDLKNIINEKDDIIKQLNEKLLHQESRIKNNENEIKKLNVVIKELKEKNEKQFIENDNEIKVVNSKLIYQDQEIKKIIQLNAKMKDINNKLLNQEEEVKKIEKTNEEINSININNISKFVHNFSVNSLHIIKKDLEYLNYLEKNFGFLSSIGIKLLLNKNYNEIEGFIRAPKNSPYKNGIFNFIIKYSDDHPNSSPELKFKTKIFHTHVRDDGHCCIKLLGLWNKNTELSLTLIGLYQFFLGNND